MKQLLPLQVAACLLLSLFACNSSGNKTQDIQLERVFAPAGSGNEKQVSDSANFDNAGNTTHPARRFLRSACLKFKVREVSESVQFLENKTRQLGGFVSYSTITNSTEDSTAFPVDRDSVLQTIHYTTEGFLTVRVPDDQLDSFLAIINPLSVFLVRREVRTEDVGLQWLANQWTRQRAITNKQRTVSDMHKRSKYPDSQLDIEQRMDQQAETADQAKLNNLTLEDAVRYSTVSLVIYQDPTTMVSKFMKPPVVEEYGTSFVDQMGQSLTEGWLLLKLLIINLARIWSLLLIVLASLIIYYRFFVARRKPRIS